MDGSRSPNPSEKFECEKNSKKATEIAPSTFHHRRIEQNEATDLTSGMEVVLVEVVEGWGGWGGGEGWARTCACPYDHLSQGSVNMQAADTSRHRSSLAASLLWLLSYCSGEAAERIIPKAAAFRGGGAGTRQSCDIRREPLGR